jgi:putative ATP-dependent endonuclease of OLD family
MSGKKNEIRIFEVRVRNFRSLKSVDITLNRLTVLIGANNSGKTSFLEALSTAVGAGRRNLTEDDIYLSPHETRRPLDRSIIIDILIRPINENGDAAQTFPEGSYWLNLWGNGISQDENDDDFMAFRTKLTWSVEKAEYTIEKRFLKEWLADSTKVEETEIKSEAGVVNAAKIEPMALHFMDAKRDIDEDIRRSGSFWRRLTNDLGLTEEDINRIESGLNDLNKEMIDKSEILRHLKTHLLELNSLISAEEEGVEVAPIARRLRDLTKGIDLNFTTKGAQTFPLKNHGMGTRSIAAILVFRAFMDWRTKNAKDDSIHPMLALEEPEAHLHPQAQRALFRLLNDIPGQIIISTHSPYVSSQVPVENLRQFIKEGPDSIVSQINIDGLGSPDIDTINRKVMNSRGEMLFARALVFFEGETEEVALPIFAEAFWGQNIHLLGISFIGVGGYNSYLPFLRMAKSFNIPWYIFSDGEQRAISQLEKLTGEIGVSDPVSAKNIIILPDENKWESYLVYQGYEDVIIKMLDKYHDTENYIDMKIDELHGAKGKKGRIRDYKSEGGLQRALIDILSQNKTGYAGPLSIEIISIEDKARRFPGKILELFETVSKDLGLRHE